MLFGLKPYDPATLIFAISHFALVAIAASYVPARRRRRRRSPGRPPRRVIWHLTLRDLPSVDEIVERLKDVDAPRKLLVEETRRVIAHARKDLTIATGIEEQVRRNIETLRQPSLKRVINATGVVLHTNLGRAARQSMAIRIWNTIWHEGRRGKRDSHTVASD